MMHDVNSHCDSCTGSGCPNLTERKRRRYSSRAYGSVREAIHSLIQGMIARTETRDWGREELSKIRQGASWQSLPTSYHAEFEGHYSGALMAIYAGLVSWCHRDPSTGRFLSAKEYWQKRKDQLPTDSEFLTAHLWLKDENNSAFVWDSTLNRFDCEAECPEQKVF